MHFSLLWNIINVIHVTNSSFSVRVVCQIGHYLDETTKECKRCVDGTYQPQASQVEVSLSLYTYRIKLLIVAEYDIKACGVQSVSH